MSTFSFILVWLLIGFSALTIDAIRHYKASSEFLAIEVQSAPVVNKSLLAVIMVGYAVVLTCLGPILVGLLLASAIHPKPKVPPFH